MFPCNINDVLYIYAELEIHSVSCFVLFMMLAYIYNP